MQTVPTMPTAFKPKKRKRMGQSQMYESQWKIIFRNIVGKELSLSDALAMHLIFNKFVKQAVFFSDLLWSRTHTLNTLKDHLQRVGVFVTPVVEVNGSLIPESNRLSSDGCNPLCVCPRNGTTFIHTECK